MVYARTALAATAAALISAVASADLSIVVPGGPDLWWGESTVLTVGRENNH